MKLLIPAIAALTLSAVSFSAVAMTSADRYGESWNAADAERTVVLREKTRSVRVQHNQIVTFVTGGQQFTWKFDGTPREFNLQRIAPAGTVTQRVRVYFALTEDDLSN